MKRIEPNFLLAVATVIPLILLIMTASLFGEPGQMVKYLIIAAIVPATFIPMNNAMRKKMGWNRPPMIHPMASSTALWASLFPGLIFLSCGIPLLFPGHDYGLLIIIAAIFFAITVESALKARQGQ